MLTDPDNAVEKKRIIVQIIINIEETAKNQGKTLEEVVDEFNSYVFNSSGENPDKCARDSTAANGVDLDIGARQEKLGIVGSLFKSSEDYSDFRKMLKDKLELLVNKGLLHALGLKNTSEISSANLNGFFNKSVPTPVANNDEDKLKSSPSKPTN
ncbi:MAG: hypothetical protein LCH30_03465 [Proteobacteria bacterium]|nr:hypothetical protein [Pseudomonadota bacterium]